MKNLFIISAIIILSGFTVSAQNIVPAEDAAKHTGKKVTVCNEVYNTKLENRTTFLYLGGDYPHQLLTIVIRNADIGKFKWYPEVDFKGKEICVTGVIVNDKGKPQIVVSRPKQIKIVMVDSPVKQNSRVN
jgi:micrococcal nuclease